MMKFKTNEHKFTKKNKKGKISSENYAKIFNVILNNEKELPSEPNRINTVDDGKMINNEHTQNIVKKKIQHIIKINPLKSITNESISCVHNKKHIPKKFKSNSKLKEIKIDYNPYLQKPNLKFQQFLTSDDEIYSSPEKAKEDLTTKRIKIKKKLLNLDKNENINDDYFLINNELKTTNKKIKINEKIIPNDFHKKKLQSSKKNNLNKKISPINHKHFDKKENKQKNKEKNINKINLKNDQEIPKHRLNKKSTNFTNKFSKNLNFNKIKINDSQDYNYNPDTIINQTTNNNINNINYTFKNHISSKKFIVNNTNSNININININNINSNTLKNDTDKKNISNKESTENQINNFSHSDNKLIRFTKNKSTNITTINFVNYNKEAQKFFDYIPNQLINRQNLNYLYGKNYNSESYSYKQRRKSENFLKNRGIKVESININLCKDTNNKKNKRNYDNFSSNTSHKNYEVRSEYDDYWSDQSSMNLSIRSATIGSKRSRRLSRERDKYKLLHNNRNDFVNNMDKKLNDIVNEFHKNNFVDKEIKNVEKKRKWKSGKSQRKSIKSLYAH